MKNDDFTLKTPTNFSAAANPLAEAPTKAQAVRFAMTDEPRGESDESRAAKAEYLGRTYFDLLQKAQQGIDPSKDDSMLRAEAVYFTKALTGQDDVYGKLWQKGGFKTGREYLERMHSFFLHGGEKNLSPELKAFREKSHEEQVAEAMEKRSMLDSIVHSVGSGASYALDWLHRADTEKLADEKGLQEDIYKEQVRSAYAAKLMADNAWYELSAIMPTLSRNAQTCAKALLESKDNRLPESLWAKFNNLDDSEKALICRVRTCLAPPTEGSLGNTLGDMAIGAANVAANVAAAPYRFGNKLGMMLSNKAFDAGFDVNELARRRQYLWQATGRPSAGGDLESGYLPQLQFEQMCQEHGFLAESLIGAISTLPYMAAASVSVPWLPFAGVATVAMEAMSEMDDNVAMAGGDITDPDYMFSNALFGAMYAYTERLQVEGLLGGVKDIELRQALLKGFWSGVKDAKTFRALTAGTLAESLQEGLQNGIMAANEALALKQDSTRAFAEGFTQDFVSSLGTMLIVEGGSLGFAHWKRSGFNNPFTASGIEAGREARSVDLETEYEKSMSLDRMVEFSARSEQLRGIMSAIEAHRLYETWQSGGKEALLKAGIDPVQAEEWDYFYSSTRNGVVQDEETGELAPDIRWQAAQQDIYRYLAHEAAKRTKAGETADLAAFDLAMENLDWVRMAWSQGAGVRRVDEEGKVQDPGAKALEGLGFSKDVAKRLSEYFHYERSAAYSPAALNGIKASYEARMEGRVTAKAALAQQFGGRIVRLDGADYLRFDGADGPSLVRIDETPGGIDFGEASEGVAVDVERATQGEVTKQDWMDATAAERRAIWKRYGLVHEGAFKPSAAVKVSLPADPSVGVDSVQAAKVIGAITLDSQTNNRKIADTSAAFHEVFHAFTQFAETSGLWTKEDIAFLEKKFGKAKMASERFDEEAGAEGFRSFLARRANGALTVEDERSPFAKIYAVAAGLDARAKEMSVQQAVAGEAERAFFHQLIAEANKPKPTPPAPKPNLPGTAAPQKGLKPSSAEAAEGKPGTETAETGTGNGESGTPKAESGTKFVQMETPTTWSAYTPTGNVKVSGHWAVLDLKDVIHSNNPLYAVHMRAQLRNRKDNKAEEDTRKDIVNNFQGERLLDAPDTANGAPIVFYDDDGTGVKRAFVLSGNGRVLVLNELAERHLYDRYRNVMKAWAEARGMFVPTGETPILVRVIDDYGGATRDKVADLSNTNAIQQYTEEEQARADAEVVKALGLARLYQANADGTPDMTPGANDEFFSEFVRGVGDTALYNSDRSLTQTARDRAQRALLAIAVGQGDRGRDVVKKLIEQTETLNIQRQKNAAAIMAAPVAALESNAAYAIGPDVSRAMADFMDYAEKRKAGKVGTFGDYFNQMDLIDGPSKIARELLKLLGSDKAAATIAEYVKAYCRAAGMEDAGGNLFGAARTREEIWADAARFVDDTIAKTQGVEPPAAQQTAEKGEGRAEAKTQPKRQQTRDTAIPKGEVRLGPATPEPARQARPPAGTVTYTINPQKGGPVTSTMPAGAFADLRGPYDPYEKTPEAKNPVRSIFSGTATRQLDPQGRYWGDKMPQFMGHKTEMFDRTVMTLRQKLGERELAKFDTLVDYFGGGGSWGMSLALAAMPNVKRIIVNEFDPGRAKKIELLQTLGESIAAEAEKMLKESEVMDEVEQRMKTAGDDGGESGSGATLANVIIRNYKSRFAGDLRKLGLMYAITDCASRQLAGSRDVRDPSTGETTKVKISFAERWAKVKEQLAQDGRNATAMRKAIEERGGTVEYVNGDSTKPDFGVGFEIPHGGNVMAVADPPYYRTEGYSDDGSSWKVGLEKTPGAYAYADTGEFLKRLVDNGDGIVYTDEAWWLKPEYMETHRVQSDGLLDDAEILAAQPEFRRENQILQGIRDAIDHFDVAGKVAGRYETLGVHHGKETRDGNDEGTGESQGSGVLPVGDVGSTGDGQGGQTDGHHSVRRLAGGAEGEDITLLRDGRGGRPEGGRRAEDAVRRIDAAIKDALPPDAAGYPGQAEEIERLARHSVRQVREGRMWEYAAFVGRNARRWITEAQEKLDQRMREAGYTEKVWHGTYGKDFNVFKFSANSHDVPAAYFTYNRGTAQNYAALNGDGDLEEFQDSQYNTRQFYINPGKVLEWDEAEKPTSLEQFIEKMKKAYEDGYNSIIVRNVLDDNGARLDEYDNGPMFFLEPGERPGDGEGTYQTDILIVMQQPGDNAPARIKAADPVTFADDELPIPLDMRADQSVADVRYSIAVTPAEDAAYMDAVKRGDMETAQRMVREAAARVMPDTKVVGDNGEPLTVYHATDNDFTVFDKRRLGELTDQNATDNTAKQLARLGFWFNTKDLRKQVVAKNVIGAYLDIVNPYRTSLDKLWAELEGKNAESFISDLKARGHDGIVLDDSEFGGKSFVAFGSNQIKSADPVTYDDAGNVIPLSERFNSDSADVRFSIAARTTPETQAEREKMRHSVFMGTHGTAMLNDKAGMARLQRAYEMAAEAGDLGDYEDRKWYTDEVRDRIYRETGWWLGTDGDWRIEVSDLKPKTRFGRTHGNLVNGLRHDLTTDSYRCLLPDICRHPTLFKAYPMLKDIIVRIVNPDKVNYGAEYDPDLNRISLTWDDVQWHNGEPSNVLNKEGLQELSHELQHAIQGYEGFALGGNTDVNGRVNYRRLAGEVEARNAAFRHGMPDDRAKKPEPWKTEDVPTIKQIITYGFDMTDIRGNPVKRHSIATSAEVEGEARRAIRAYTEDGGNKAANDALENYVAYFKLAHGSIPRASTLARIGLSLGMNVVDPKRILKNAEKLAEQMKGSVVERASQNGDVATAMAMMKREKDISKNVENLIAGGAEMGGRLTHKGVGRINSLLQRRVDSMMRSFTAATLADMEGDTGIDIAAEILENNPDAFDTEYRKAKKAIADEAETADEGGEGRAATYAPYVESEMSDADRYKHDVLLREAAERVARFIEAAKARAEENGAKAAEARERKRIVEVGGGDEGDGTGGAEMPPASAKWDITPKGVKANFKTPEEFAAFLRVWARDKFAKTHGLTTLGQVEQDRLFAEFYRICVRQELQDLADKLLAPKMMNDKGEMVTNQRLAKLGNGARVWVSRRIGDIEKGMRPDSIERESADIFAFINKAAIRVSRVDLITQFRQELKSRYLEGPRFEELKLNSERKLTGWLEESTRYIMRVCSLSRKSVNGDPSELEREYSELHNIIDERARVYDESGHDVADAAKEDAETRKAQWKLALLDKYGAMQSLMPGEILDLQNQAYDYLENEAMKLEQSWQETREEQNRVRGDLSAAIVGPNGQRYQDKNIFTGRLFDALNGMIRLRFEHLTRFAGVDKREKAKDAINAMMVMLGDGEVAYARALQGDREAFFTGLGEIFKTADGKPDNAAIKKYLERMDKPIPEELSRQLSNQGFVGTMTFGQMLQLLVSLEQKSFRDTIEANGREGQAELIRSFRYRDEDGKAVNAFTKEDDAFVNMLRAFYAAKRDQLSEVTERMVGLKVDSPDPLYCPIRRFIDDKARSLHSDPTQRWDPISKIFSRRVPSVRDFDESRTIVGLFFENSKESAKLVAWAERGSFIRNVVTSVGFQSAVKRAFGPGELSKILKQLEATFNGGEQRSQTPGEVAAADKAVNFVTYAYLGFNPLSALKQTTSFAVWANQLPNGFGDLWRHMTHFDPKVLKHLMESDEYRVRYGNAVGSGMDYATKGVNLNPSQNPVSRALSGAGLWMLKRGDFIPGGWIAQGVYKDLLDKHLKEGMDFDAADRQAITETFNMLEETQQSGRTYNTNMLQIEHGRIGRLLTQFATSPLQQLQYETQAFREWRDMVRYNQGEEKIAAARAKFRRAVVINHVIIPAALNLVIAMYKAALGEEPPWEKDGYHWTLLIDMLLGQFSRVFFLGAFAQTTLTALLKRETPRMGQMLPIEGAMGMAASGAFLIHDLATMNVDKVQKDLERVIKSTAPTRLPYSIYRRITGDSDQDRKRQKEAAKRK